MAIIFKQKKQDRSSISLVIAFGSIIFFLFLLSQKAVNHPVHAIEIGSGRFIHGGNLNCVQSSDSPHHHHCDMLVNGEPFQIKTWPRFADYTDGPYRCHAWFNEQKIKCEEAYITASYWQQGIRVSGSPELAEAYQQVPFWRNWQSYFYGWSETEYVQLGTVFTILYTLLAFTIMFKRRTGQASLPTWLTASLIGIAFLFVALFLSPRVIPPLVEWDQHTYWEIWGLPILMFAAFIITGASTGRKKDKTEFQSAMVMSLLLSSLLYFLMFGIVIVTMLSLSFID